MTNQKCMCQENLTKKETFQKCRKQVTRCPVRLKIYPPNESCGAGITVRSSDGCEHSISDTTEIVAKVNSLMPGRGIEESEMEARICEVMLPSCVQY